MLPLRSDLADDLNLPLDRLRATQSQGVLAHDAGPVPGLVFRIDPEARISGHWHSPRGRLLELRTTVDRPGAWLGLHLTLPPFDLTGITWLGFAARSAADPAQVARACLRSGLDAGGFRDDFFPRDLLSHGFETDHVDLLAPDHHPDLPRKAPWREFVLFLPPVRDIRWTLHSLRLFVL